eukprot:14366765-Alexandrium_andersonii.AAC.1
MHCWCAADVHVRNGKLASAAPAVARPSIGIPETAWRLDSALCPAGRLRAGRARGALPRAGRALCA